jgi:hypothetical protein
MSQINARLVYRNAVQKMRQAGVNPQTAVLSQSYLRLEVQASASKTSYQFGVLVNDAPAGATTRPTENRLNLQDAFYTSSVQMFFYKTASTTATNGQLRSYPNPRDLGATQTDSTGLYQLYNGQLSLTVNNRVITPSWDLYRHMYIPQTQQTAFVSGGIVNTSTTNIDQFDGLTSSSCACEPNWVLIGSKNNNLSLSLPSAITSVTDYTYITLILRGVLAQNVTVVS